MPPLNDGRQSPSVKKEGLFDPDEATWIYDSILSQIADCLEEIPFGVLKIERFQQKLIRTWADTLKMGDDLLKSCYPYLADPKTCDSEMEPQNLCCVGLPWHIHNPFFRDLDNADSNNSVSIEEWLAYMCNQSFRVIVNNRTKVPYSCS